MLIMKDLLFFKQMAGTSLGQDFSTSAIGILVWMSPRVRLSWTL